MRLSWVRRDGAGHYRVEILSAEPSEVLERYTVTEPELELHGLALPAGARWRVRSSVDGRRWELHVPPVALPIPPVGVVTEVHWEPTGAPAYRLMVRDDQLGQVVLKTPVIGPPAYVDWAQLDRDHRHRVRVQEWRAREWSNIEPYRPLAPPPPSRLSVDVAELIAPAVRHAVLVRLSGAPPGGVHGARRPRAWLAQRLSLLREWTLPSPASAVDGSGVFLIVCDSELPGEELQSLRGSYPEAVFGPGDADALRSALRRLAAGAEVLAVTELTAGDRSHPELLRRIHEHAAHAPPATRQLVSFELAVRWDRERDLAAIERYPSALVHTVLLPAAGPGIAEEALDRSRRFIDPAYRQIADASIVASLRAWPGPNAFSALHGERLAEIGVGELREVFALRAAQEPAGASV